MATSENNEIVEENYKNTINSSSMNVDSNSAHTLESMPVISIPSFKFPLESTSKKRAHKLISDVWNHFERKIVNGKDVAVCNYCKSNLKGGGHSEITSLKNHLTVCSSKTNLSIKGCFERQKQISVQKKNDGKVRFENFLFDQDVSRNELASAIILHECSLSLVDHVGFRRFVSSLQPLFKMVSRNTIKEDIFKIYNSENVKLMDVFEKLRSRIAITIDMWTSNQNKGYMSITAHFLIDFWVLQNRILR
ncbi:hypothetical protein CRYUN_Cryun37aG0019400 [Craigia yunnanensis]